MNMHVKVKQCRLLSMPPGRRAMAVIARAYRVNPSDILNPCRRQPYVIARHAAWYRAWCKTPRPSFPLIGMIFQRDSTTIRHGIMMHCERNNLPAPAGMNEWRKDANK